MPAPDLHLTLGLTHDCNLRCRYCYGGAKAPRHMTLATGLRAIEEALGRLRAGRLHLIFFGGEPLLRWDTLVELTERASLRAGELGVELRPSVTTNGTLLTAERARWLAARGFVVAVSCDGCAAAHDSNRVGPSGRGSHGRTVEGLRAALGAGLRSVRAVLVLHPGTVHLLAESVAYLVDLGADDLVVNVDWSADWSGEATERRWKDAYEALGRGYVEAYRRGRPFWVSVLDDKIATHVRGGYGPGQLCDLGRRDLVVAPSGRLYPCDRLIGEDRDGRLAIGELDRGLDPERLAALVGGACRLPAACFGCAIAERCRNRCACANLAMTGSLDAPSALLCFHEQLAVRTADRAASALAEERNELFCRKHLAGV